MSVTVAQSMKMLVIKHYKTVHTFWNSTYIFLTLLATHFHVNYLHGVLLQKLTVTWLVKKFPAVYGNRSFINAFTKAYHWTYPEPDESSQHLPILF